MKKLILSLLFFIISGSAFAMLEPYAESTRQIDLILKSQELYSKIHGYPIKSIRRIDSASSEYKYEIETLKCKAEVIVEVAYPTQPGSPLNRTLKIEKSDCKNTN